jgi:hypothetical protein
LTYKRLLILSSLFVMAITIRLYHVNEPPMNFHAVRQYRSLLIARGYYYQSIDGIPEWQKQVAKISMQRRGMWEPHIMESLVSLVYRIVGGEHYWIPRVLSSVFWLIGAGFLFAIAKKICDADAAVFSTAFYLFLPFGIIASRSFQPDPLMVMGLLTSVFTILRYYEKPLGVRLLTAAIVSALAILIKSVSLFTIWGAFVSIGIHTLGLRKWALNVRTLTFAAISLLPALGFYSYGMFISTSLLSVAQGDILPHLLIAPAFWKGWLLQIGTVVGYPAFITALFGILMFRDGLPRVLLMGLWGGYLVFGMVFTYTVHTHDYWNLQIIPIVALSIGPVASLVIHHLLDTYRGWHWRAVIGGIGLLALALSIGIAGSRLANPGFEHKVRAAQEVGEQVGHSTDIIHLSGDYGLPLEYHGMLSGKPWPLISDLEWERLAGVPVLDAEERFSTRLSKYRPEYFIVEDLREFEQQPDLRRFLSRFPMVSDPNGYLIFHLKER